MPICTDMMGFLATALSMSEPDCLLQAATFPCAAFPTQYGWGMLSDRIGRKVRASRDPSESAYMSTPKCFHSLRVRTLEEGGDTTFQAAIACIHNCGMSVICLMYITRISTLMARKDVMMLNGSHWSIEIQDFYVQTTSNGANPLWLSQGHVSLVLHAHTGCC